MQTYRLLAPIMLTFLTPQDSYDVMFSPVDLEPVTLRCDGHTIWVVNCFHGEHESITTANAIDLWLEQGKIELDTTD